MINSVVNKIGRELTQIKSFCMENGMRDYGIAEIEYNGSDSDNELVYIVVSKNDSDADLSIVSLLTIKDGKVVIFKGDPAKYNKA